VEMQPRDLTPSAKKPSRTPPKKPPKKPSVRQVFALAAVLCEREGVEFPATREAASELIERLRLESGHPRPRREDTPPPPERRRVVVVP
jgi:hypothetical protein